MRIKNFRQFYTVESSVYHKKRYQTLYGKLFKDLHHQVLNELIANKIRGNFILEVACGTGHTSELLAAHGMNIIACDLTPAMMEHAEERVKQYSVESNFVQADAKQLPFTDKSMDFVISTRFMHLFSLDDQREIIREMLRVLKPGGFIILDFDNWTSRWLLVIPYLLYNLIRYQRLAPFSHYNCISETCAMLKEEGIVIETILGVGGTHLFLLSLISYDMATRIGRAHRQIPLRLLAEQFVISGRKR